VSEHGSETDLARFFMPVGEEKAKVIIEKVIALTEGDARFTLNQVLTKFSQRHRNISRIFEKHCEQVEHVIKSLDVDAEKLTQEKKLLIGSYFTMEYSIESAAFLIKYQWLFMLAAVVLGLALGQAENVAENVSYLITPFLIGLP